MQSNMRYTVLPLGSGVGGVAILDSQFPSRRVIGGGTYLACPESDSGGFGLGGCPATICDLTECWAAGWCHRGGRLDQKAKAAASSIREFDEGSCMRLLVVLLKLQADSLVRVVGAAQRALWGFHATRGGDDVVGVAQQYDDWSGGTGGGGGVLPVGGGKDLVSSQAYMQSPIADPQCYRTTLRIVFIKHLLSSLFDATTVEVRHQRLVLQPFVDAPVFENGHAANIRYNACGSTGGYVVPGDFGSPAAQYSGVTYTVTLRVAWARGSLGEGLECGLKLSPHPSWKSIDIEDLLSVFLDDEVIHNYRAYCTEGSLQNFWRLQGETWTGWQRLPLQDHGIGLKMHKRYNVGLSLTNTLSGLLFLVFRRSSQLQAIACCPYFLSCVMMSSFALLGSEAGGLPFEFSRLFLHHLLRVQDIFLLLPYACPTRLKKLIKYSWSF
nr:hypothetical protein Iba_chr04aCG6360 [Ipomoea batatas]